MEEGLCDECAAVAVIEDASHQGWILRYLIVNDLLLDLNVQDDHVVRCGKWSSLA